MLEPVLLLLVNELTFRIERPQLGNGTDPRRVVGRYGGTLEALVKDARTETEAFGVVCGVEDFALDLGALVGPKRA
jgi:hypothetical protein